LFNNILQYYKDPSNSGFTLCLMARSAVDLEDVSYWNLAQKEVVEQM